MSWTNIKATGRGKLEFRLMIEGWPYEWVSHVDMEQTVADSRVRMAGLMREGIVLEEQCKPHLAETEGRAITFRIVDRQRDDAATKAFFTLPTMTAWLASDATTATSSLTLLSTSTITANDVVHVGTEAILVGNTATTATLSSCTRAYWDTIAQAHYTFNGADGLGEARVTDQPLGMEGRRAYLYVYGEGDDLTGDGTLVWRGICSTDARLSDDGCTWEVSVDPIFRVLEQEIGADLEDVQTVRGIFYPRTAPLILFLEESADTDVGTPFWSSPVFIYGFYATPEALAAEVQSQIDSLVSSRSLDNDYRVVTSGNDDWWIECNTDAASPKFPFMGFISPMDGTNGYCGGGYAHPGIQDVDRGGAHVESVAASTRYKTIANNWAGIIGQRTTPRGHLGNYTDAGGRPGGYPEDRDIGSWTPPTNGSTVDNLTLFPASFFSLSGLAGSTIEITRGGATLATTIGAVDATARSISIDDMTPEVKGVYTREDPVTFSLTLSLTANGSLDDVRDYICDNSPTETNRARLPFVTGDDGGTKGDLADWTTVIDSVKEAPITANRQFHVVDAVTLAEYFREEWRLLGVFPALDSNGRITLRTLSVPLATDAGLTALTASEHLIDDGFATWERNAWGTLNAVKIAMGYDAKEDEYERYVVVRDKGTYPNRKAPKHLIIEPKSRINPIVSFYADAGEIDAAAVELGSRALGLFGRDYGIITAGVPLTVFDTLVGDKVLLTLAHVPDGLGGRGLTSEPAVVVGRRWDLDQGRGEMQFLVQYQNLGGYTPGVTITGETDNGGNEWSLTVSSDSPSSYFQSFQDGHNMSDHFVAGDEIRVRQWNLTSPTTQTGEVVSVVDTQAASGATPATGTIVVQLDGAASLSATTWILGYDVGTAPAETGQQDYVYFADSSALVTFSSDVDAYEYSG